MNTVRCRPCSACLLALALAACAPQPGRDEPAALPTTRQPSTRSSTPIRSTAARCTRRSSATQPGTCPICGMTLVEVEESAAGNAPRRPPRCGSRLPWSTTWACAPNPSCAAACRDAREVVGLRRASTNGACSRCAPRAEGWVEGLNPCGRRARRSRPGSCSSRCTRRCSRARNRNTSTHSRSATPTSSTRRASGCARWASTRARPPVCPRSGRAAGRVAFHAPVAGVVTELEAREGAMLSPDMIAMTITELGSLWVVAEVPEAQSAWLRAGTRRRCASPRNRARPCPGRSTTCTPNSPWRRARSARASRFAATSRRATEHARDRDPARLPAASRCCTSRAAR